MCLKIKLEKVIDVQRFVAKASKHSNLTIRSDNSVVNANSLMGVFSLDLENPVYLCWDDNRQTEQINKDFKQWVV